MGKMKTVEMILMEWYPDGIYNEDQLWEAIAEANGVDYSEIAYGDLFEWLYFYLPFLLEYLQALVFVQQQLIIQF